MTKNTHVRDDRDVYFQYLNDISKYPLLTKEQEKVVLAKVREGSREAMDLLVKSNLRFVVNIANLYKGQGIDVNELINEGNMGLIEAARRFDHSQGSPEHHPRHRGTRSTGPHQRRKGTRAPPLRQEGRRHAPGRWRRSHARPEEPRRR